MSNTTPSSPTPPPHLQHHAFISNTTPSSPTSPTTAASARK
eukprot:gene1701-11894_t